LITSKLVVEMPGSPIPAAMTLGAVSGMRSMMAPAIISWAARRSGLDLESTPFSAFKGQRVGRAAAALALGELVADKTPLVGERTDAAALAGRAISGAASGAAVFKARKNSMLLGALVGAAASMGAAYATHYLRKEIVRRYPVSDRMVAILEDVIAISAGLIAVAITNSGQKAIAEEESQAVT
jgi:uncharacterized membrane protein